MKIGNKNILIEILIISICTLAATIGPKLFINAVFSAGFILGGLIAALISMLLFHGIYLLFSRHQMVCVVGGVLSFVSYILLVSWHDFENLFDISWGTGLVNFPFIIGFISLLVLYLSYAGRDIFQGFSRVGAGFLLPFTIVLIAVPFMPSSEGKVLFSNVALIYLFIRTILIPHLES